MHNVQGLGASAHFVRASRPSLVGGVRMATTSHPTSLPRFAAFAADFPSE